MLFKLSLSLFLAGMVVEQVEKELLELLFMADLVGALAAIVELL
jgi:hypothetical protein